MASPESIRIASRRLAIAPRGCSCEGPLAALPLTAVICEREKDVERILTRCGLGSNVLHDITPKGRKHSLEL